jgi:hypothetical protein
VCIDDSLLVDVHAHNGRDSMLPAEAERSLDAT